MNNNSFVKLRTGNELPVIGIGTWKLQRRTADTIADALEVGYPMIDTSGDYGTQPGIAEGIKRSGVSRSDFYLVTKVEETDDAYQKTVRDLEELALDYADLMLIHRPPEDGAGVELWEGLIRAKQEGLTRDIGVSNYSSDQIDELISATGEVPVVNQVEWSPFGHSDALRSYAKDHHIVIQAYSPLTRGTRLDDAVLQNIGKRRGKTPAQVIIRWNLQNGVVPLPKANQKTHLEENIAVFDFELDETEMVEIGSLNERYSALGSLPYD